MNGTSTRVTTTATVFIGLAVVYAALVVAASLIGDVFAQGVLIGTDAASLGSGLTFLLLSALGRAEKQV
jgi:hypothetical protein